MEDQRHEDTERGNKEDKGRIGRVDRNKRSDITRDKARRLEKLCSKRNEERWAPKIAREERKDSCRRWKNVRLVVVVVVWVGFCRASKIAAVYLTQPTEIPFHLASRIYRAAFSPYSPPRISPSRTPFPSLSLALGHPPQLFLVDSYLFHSRHSHRVRDLSASPIGPRLAEISCGAPRRAAYIPL